MGLPPIKNALSIEKSTIEGGSKMAFPFLALAGIELFSNILGSITSPKPPKQRMSVQDALVYELANRYRSIRAQREASVSMASALTGLPRERFTGVAGINKLQTFDWNREIADVMSVNQTIYSDNQNTQQVAKQTVYKKKSTNKVTQSSMYGGE